jgi:hypothetical protein
MGVYLDADGQFDTRKPVDDLPRFVPGSDLDTGASVLISEESGQEITLWVGPSTDGSVTAAFESVSRYPGIAMNDPVENASTDPDVVFGDGSLDPVTETFTKQRKWVSIPLVIRDYGAQATIRITRPRPDGKPPVVRRVQIPVDKNGNSLPDVGWKYLNSYPNDLQPILDTQLDAAADIDDSPEAAPLPDSVSGVPKTLGMTGDGLTTFEEYRGFFIRGEHRRLNPFRKDLFVRVDPALDNYDAFIYKLPITFHKATRDDVIETDGIRPLINPNRADIPGALPQHGVSIRQRDPSPRFWDPVTQLFTRPVWYRIFGRAYDTTQSLTHVVELAYVSVPNPNTLAVVEVYPRAFGRDGITHAPGVPLATFLCEGSPGCDDEYDALGDQIYPGFDQVLDSIRHPDDFGILRINDCQTSAWSTLLDREFALEKMIAVAHEGGHGLQVDHADYYIGDDSCGTSIMHSKLDVDPRPTEFLELDTLQIRLHNKF